MKATSEVEKLLDRLRGLLTDEDGQALRRVADSVRPQLILECWERLRPKDRLHLLAYLSRETAAELLANLPEEEQHVLLETLSPPAARDVLEEMEPDDLVDALQVLESHDPGSARALIDLLSPETRAVAEALTGFDEEEAGGLMTPEFISLQGSMTVESTLRSLRRAAPDAETVYYLYVVDDEDRLTGVLTLRELIVAGPETRLREIMDPDVVLVGTETDQEEVARIMGDYDLSVLPVVDDRGKLVGIVTFDDVLDVVEIEATEDIHRMGAAPIDVDYPRSSPFLLFRKRAPWLVLLVVSMTLTFNVISLYEDVLAQVVVLAAFIPLLIGTGGNVGSQVATMVVRSLSTRELEGRDFFQVLRKESGTGLMLGVSLGAFTGFYVMLFEAEPRIATALGITMVLITLTANLVGASLPFFFRKLGIDPALTSTPGITTVMDVVGLLVYFQVVIWVLGPLIQRG